MSFIQILLIAIALSFDAMAVGAVNGARHHQMSHIRVMYIALFFGFFQFIMPLVGWYLGNGVVDFLMKFGNWIAFILLCGIGVRMIFESFKTVEEKKIDIANFFVLFLLAVVTSIDALVIGISFAFIETNVFYNSLVIGFVTFMLSFVSIYIGKKLGSLCVKKSEIIGGVILITIGFKILVTHLFS
ncbi:MAG: manganese efflux pump [Candidatus Magasanikbacteria bacterium]|nr:manganese efflux pump [Candidatus Magasanikbacteria bacterium]